MKKKVMLVFGTRPEAIKMAPLFHALKEEPDFFDVSVCVTAQHRHMLDQVLDVFEIKPEFDLNLMKTGQDLFDITTSALIALREVLQSKKPDAILVHGDTTTSMAASLAAYFVKIPVGHVEAGLRTHDIYSPYPEELNRQVTARIARWHFAPTNLSRENLLQENTPDHHITITGNTVIDAMNWVLKRFERQPHRLDALFTKLGGYLPFDWQNSKYILVTGHRRENFGAGFLEICHAMKQIAQDFPECHIIYPVHLNPNVQKPVREILSGIPNIHLIEPMEYEPFLLLLRHCYLVLTDSGGIQEEAPSLGKPVLVMRDVTERPEAIEAGTVRLVGANKERIYSEACNLLTNREDYKRMSLSHNPYGDGKASERIVKVLREI